MREHIFRALNCNKEMYEWKGPNTSSKDKSPVMQFTGLIDECGKKVFEGDILTTSKYQNPTIFYVVKYHAPSFILMSEHPFENKLLNTKDMIVIGNIYENGDLLE